MRNRLALGIAGGDWGGRSLAGADKHSLTAGDFPHHTAQELDDYVVATDDTPEPRPRLPATWGDWLRRTKREANIFALVYGEEWRTPLGECLRILEGMNDDSPDVFPREVVKDIWEELMWRFWEELKEVLRQLKQQMGRENVRTRDLALFALTPDGRGRAWFQAPRTFDLHFEAGWFRSSILPRIERRHERAMWDLSWKGVKPAGTQLGSGRAGEEPQQPQQPGETRAGGAGTYPAGQLLSTKEVSAANEHTPLDDKGTPLCWAALTHMGCSKSAAGCGRSHAALRGKFADLHWTVQAQLIRRGGLRSGRLIPDAWRS